MQWIETQYAYHIVDSEFLEFATNLMFQKIISTKGVDVHVSTHRNKLGTRKVIKGNVIMEEFGNSNDISLIRGLPSGSNLHAFSFIQEIVTMVKAKHLPFGRTL